MSFMGNIFGGSERTKFIELFKESIRIYLSRKFYLEGQQKDYYFGKSLIGDDFSVFCNDPNILSIIGEAIDYAYDRVWKMFENSFFTEYGPGGRIDLYRSAFNIHVYSKDRLWYMPAGVLENAIKENPERWEMYLKYKDVREE